MVSLKCRRHQLSFGITALSGFTMGGVEPRRNDKRHANVGKQVRILIENQDPGNDCKHHLGIAKRRRGR